MNTSEIPIIIPNFNQLTYLRNLINQLRFYYPENPITIIDNGSDYAPLLKHYDSEDHADIHKYERNDFISNLKDFLEVFNPEYYIISDPDISIPPATPPNFLEIFKAAIDNHGFHHAGFGLKTDDLPAWNPKAGWIRGDELDLLKSPVTIAYEGKEYTGYKAPIDTTAALYKRDNGGWSAPMPPKAWDNSVRIFEAVHLPWYLSKDHLNDEMKHYYATCKGRDNSLPSAGRNHYKPE